MSIAKKFGLYLDADNVDFVEQIQNKHGFTKISNTINHIIREYKAILENSADKEDGEEQACGKFINWDEWVSF